MGELIDIVEAYRARFNPHPPSYRRVAMLIGMSPTALGNWSAEMSRLPDRGNLLALAELTGVPYLRVLDAALTDARYLPEPAAEAAHQAVVAKLRRDGQRVIDFILETLGITRSEWLQMSREEREALLPRFSGKGQTRDEAWLLTNARAMLRGQIKSVPWEVAKAIRDGRLELVEDSGAEEEAPGMSEPTDTPEDLIAADDQGQPIGGEQLEPENP